MAVLLRCTLVVFVLAAFLTLTSCEESSSSADLQLSTWVRCDYNQNPGFSCNDCNSRLLCTRIGGFIIPCWLPGRGNCVDGACRVSPSNVCALKDEVIGDTIVN